MPRKRGGFLLANNAVSSQKMLKQRQLEWVRHYKEMVDKNTKKEAEARLIKVRREELTGSFSREAVGIITDNDYNTIKVIINNASTFKSGNSIILAMHACSSVNGFEKRGWKYNNKFKVVFNNLMNLKLNDIDNIIIVISTNNNEMLTRFIEVLSKYFNKNLIFIRDITNKYYDFGKYKIAYKYLTQQGMSPHYIHLMNDSFIICEEVGHICDNIVDKLKTKDFIGIVDSLDILPHYSSWWLVIKRGLYEKYFDEMALVNHKDISQTFLEKKYRTVLRNEVIPSNKIIRDPSFNCDFLFSGKVFAKEEHPNIFWNPSVFINAWVNGMKIMKMHQPTFACPQTGQAWRNHPRIAAMYMKYLTRIDNIEI